jgi:lipid-binding SYLF domain-containing protein
MTLRRYRLVASLKLGVDASVAAGPVGVGGQAATTSNLRADIVSFARSKGLFLGVSIEGAVMEPRSTWNEGYYQKGVTPADVLFHRVVQRAATAPLIEAVQHAAAATS